MNLSPTGVATFLRCQVQHWIFREEKHVALPEVAMEVRRRTHSTILVEDIGSVLRQEARPSDEELVERYVEMLREDDVKNAPDIATVGGPDKLRDAEAKAMKGLLAASKPWRLNVVPVEIEKPIKVELGSVTVHGYLDIEEAGKVVDLKRRAGNSKAYTLDQTANSLQLVPYALAVGAGKVAYVSLKEGDTGRVAGRFLHERYVEAPVSPGSVRRVTDTYEAVAAAIKSGIRIPVDRTSSAGWVCSARWCGAWRIGSRDWVTGQDISCPYGERSSVSVAVQGGLFDGSVEAEPPPEGS